MTHVNGRTEPLEPDDAVDLVRRYLRQVAHTDLLTAEEEIHLAKQVEAGLYAHHLLESGDEPMPEARREELEEIAAQGKRAKDHMVRANLRLVVSVAKKYVWTDLTFLDLIQEGNLGLIRAVEKFDYAKGYKFSTYAMWWIRQAIQRGIAASGRNVRLPSHVLDEINKVRRQERDLAVELGRDPTVEEIATRSSLPEARVRELRRISRPTVSLETPLGLDADTSIKDLLPDEHGDHAIEIVEHQALARQLRDIVGTLPPREALILSLRFGLTDGRQHSLGEVADRVGLTKERIRQLEKQSLAELRDPERHHSLLAWAG